MAKASRLISDPKTRSIWKLSVSPQKNVFSTLLLTRERDRRMWTLVALSIELGFDAYQLLELFGNGFLACVK